MRGTIVQDWARRQDLRSEQFPAIDALTQRQNEVDVGAHVPSADHAVSDEEIERLRARPLVMRVHVPKTGDEELAGSVHTRRLSRDRDVPADFHDGLSPG